MIKVVQASITELSVDAIINAANTSLLGGGGVDGAIHRKGGKEILEDCIKIRNRQGGCKVGEAVITSAGNLPAKYVIHTVGPRWSGGNRNEDLLLRNAYNNSLKLASEHGVKTLAFPNISTGIYGYPKDQAAKIAIDTVVDALQKSYAVDKVIFVCYDKENYQLYLDYLAEKYGLVSGRFTSLLD